MRYRELQESPLAMPGDWDEGDVIIAQQSLLVHQKYWKKVGVLHGNKVVYDITQGLNAYLVGRQDLPKDKFIVIGRLDLDDEPVSISYGYPNLRSVSQVVVHQDYRGFQVATQLYRFVVKSGITLLSDMSQYFGARRLWARLSQQADMVVDVVDTARNAVVAREVQLHQGKLDADFDKEYWSYDINAGKHNIRFVLRDITSAVATPLALGE